jgi:hypothetical protein
LSHFGQLERNSLSDFCTGGDLKASLVFTALFLMQRVRFPIVMFPFILSSLVDFKVSLPTELCFTFNPSCRAAPPAYSILKTLFIIH